MGKPSVTIILALLAVVASAQARLQETKENQPACACPRIYSPVCGSDGVTYVNRCEFKCEARTKSGLTMIRQGRCDEEQEDKSSPIKTSDQDSSSNSVENDSSNCFCTMEYRPVCANNGRTYSNKCVFGCDKAMKKELEILHNGMCVDESQNMIL